MPDFTRAVIEYRGETLGWRDVVGRLRAMDEQRGALSFEMGDLALAAVPMGEGPANNGAEEKLKALAEQAGVSFPMLRQRRQVSHLTAPGTRVPGVAWSAYREVALNAPAADRPRLLAMLATTAPPPGASVSGRWTVSALRVAMGNPPILHVSEPIEERLERATIEERVAAAATLLDTPEVAAAAAEPGSAVATAMEGLTDRVIKQREDEAGLPPTESVRTFEERVKQEKANSPAYQYDRLMAQVAAFMATYTPEAVADDVVHSPHTTQVGRYDEQAERVAVWFRAFREGLKTQSRPRLVAVGRDAS